MKFKVKHKTEGYTGELEIDTFITPTFFTSSMFGFNLTGNTFTLDSFQEKEDPSFGDFNEIELLPQKIELDKDIILSLYETDSPEDIRDSLIILRNNCLSSEFDPDGAVILSHAIRWLSFKVEGKPYEAPTD